MKKNHARKRLGPKALAYPEKMGEVNTSFFVTLREGQTVAVFFFDVPNLVSFHRVSYPNGSFEVTNLLHPGFANWYALARHLAMHDGAPIPIARVFFCGNESILSPFRTHYNNIARLVPIEIAYDSSDTAMTTFIMDTLFLVEEIDKISEQEGKGRISRVKLMIISGDGGFLFPTEKIRKRFAERGIQTSVGVASWRGSISWKLMGTDIEVTFLEQVLSIVDPYSFSAYQEKIGKGGIVCSASAEDLHLFRPALSTSQERKRRKEAYSR